MARGIFKIATAALLVSAAGLTTADAGGFSRGSADTDIIYEDGNFNIRAGAVIVSPTRKFTGNANPALVGTDYADTYVVPSAAIKLNITDDLRCAGTFAQVYGGSATWAAPTASGKLSETFTINEAGATCGYKFDLSKGRVWVLGGVYQEMFDYSRLNFRTAATRFNLGLNGTAIGWRAGIAYEIPEIKLRAQLMYRAASSYGATGNIAIQTLAGVPVGGAAAFGTGDLPQSVELNLQSGVAPGWLALASVKWTDWSVTKQLIVTVPALGAVQTNDYYWRDGWTVMLGVGHAFSEKLAGKATITWDRGVKTGYDLSSDTWTLGSGLAYTDDMGGVLSFGGGVTYISSAATTFGAPEAVGSGYAFAVGANYKTKW